MYNLALEEIKRIERDIAEAQRKVEMCIKRTCLSEREKMAAQLKADLKIRDSILQIYSAQMVNSNWSTPNWGMFLASIFTEPTQDVTWSSKTGQPS